MKTFIGILTLLISLTGQAQLTPQQAWLDLTKKACANTTVGIANASNSFSKGLKRMDVWMNKNGHSQDHPNNNPETAVWINNFSSLLKGYTSGAKTLLFADFSQPQLALFLQSEGYRKTLETCFPEGSQSTKAKLQEVRNNFTHRFVDQVLIGKGGALATTVGVTAYSGGLSKGAQALGTKVMTFAGKKAPRLSQRTVTAIESAIPGGVTGGGHLLQGAFRLTLYGFFANFIYQNFSTIGAFKETYRAVLQNQPKESIRAQFLKNLSESMGVIENNEITQAISEIREIIEALENKLTEINQGNQTLLQKKATASPSDQARITEKINANDRLREAVIGELQKYYSLSSALTGDSIDRNLARAHESEFVEIKM